MRGMVFFVAVGIVLWGSAAAELPRIQNNHGAWQLMVDGKN